MRILHIISSVNPAGGGPIEGIKQLGQMNSLQGNYLEVVSMDSPDAPYLQGFPLTLHAVGPAYSNYWYAPKFKTWLQSNKNKYDIFIMNGIWQYNSYALWRALRNTGQPYFVYLHGTLNPWFKNKYPLKHIKKSVYWYFIQHRILQDAASVIFTCENERLISKNAFYPYRFNETVVNYGTSTPTGDLKVQKEIFLNAYPELKGKHILLYLGRIHPVKGCDLLIESYGKIQKHYPDLRLVIAGSDPINWKDDLSKLANKFGVADKIIWTGMLTGDMKWGAFRAAKVFILPSHCENFGIVVAEAMACELPVLITDKVNIWQEILADNAGLVDEDTENGITSLLQRWLSLLDNEQFAMRANARRCFEQRFDIVNAAESLSQVLNRYSVKG